MEISPLLRIIGCSVENRVLDFLIEGRGLDYTKTDIAEGTGISRPTLYKLWNSLLEEDVVTKTRSVGRAELYVLNEKSEKVRFLLKLEEMLLKKSFEDAGAKMLVKAHTSSRKL